MLKHTAPTPDALAAYKARLRRWFEAGALPPPRKRQAGRDEPSLRERILWRLTAVGEERVTPLSNYLGYQVDIVRARLHELVPYVELAQAVNTSGTGGSVWRITPLGREMAWQLAESRGKEFALSLFPTLRGRSDDNRTDLPTMPAADHPDS